MVKQDSDFCTYYKDVNPYYYTVWVCPHCGFAAQDSEFGELSSLAAEKIQRFLSDRAVNVNYSGIRSREQAIATYKLAIYYADLAGLPASKSAGLYLRLGWLFREGQQGEEEKKALTNALQYFDKALSGERLPIGGMSEWTIIYLVGELLRRTGEVEQSLLYFNKIVSNQQAKLEKRVYNLARDAWHEARQARDLGAERNEPV
jgi:uncharacterized protein (DUF2225 family)